VSKSPVTRLAISRPSWDFWNWKWYKNSFRGSKAYRITAKRNQREKVGGTWGRLRLSFSPSPIRRLVSWGAVRKTASEKMGEKRGERKRKKSFFRFLSPRISLFFRLTLDIGHSWNYSSWCDTNRGLNSMSTLRSNQNALFFPVTELRRYKGSHATLLPTWRSTAWQP